ncbi:hypothetical protein FJT64_022514 [Amphibalanus amphitrite]|uniref:Prokineticin domain-containing protein n=1 Tax=Amphibalanus amphitrite TaxID=1232801 RepID=A0A6A4WF12_AMPAM|nr:hypothetical protein FJT64_022514 [Amphibalanus amphitrite]
MSSNAEPCMESVAGSHVKYGISKILRRPTATNMGVTQLAAIILLVPVVGHSFLFPLKDGAVCKDNADCMSPSFPRGCCLMTGLQHGRPIGRCQPIPKIGEYCAPGDRSRRILGYSVYTFWCPCDVGLTCQPVKLSRMPSGMDAYTDPQCVPEAFPEYVTARPIGAELELGVTAV